MTGMKTLRRRLGERAFAAPEYPATSPAEPEIEDRTPWQKGDDQP